MPDPSTEALIRFELRNSKPVDLLDLTNALSPFGEAYQDHVVESGFEIDRGNIRLFIREIRSGSIVADLASIAEQASLVLRHIDVAAGFVTHLDQLCQFFLGLVSLGAPPSKREAQQVMSVMEPVAKDGSSQLFINVRGDVHVHYHYDSQQANAIQNAARRYLGPQLPASQIYQDQLLTLFQVRGDVASTVGDRGVIETISPDPVKLGFCKRGREADSCGTVIKSISVDLFGRCGGENCRWQTSPLPYFGGQGHDRTDVGFSLPILDRGRVLSRSVASLVGYEAKN